MSIQDLKLRLSCAQARRQEIDEEISGIQKQIAALDCPFKVGDTVEFGYRKESRRRGIVVDIVFRYGDWALLVHRLRKDGSRGAEIRVSKYENPEMVPA